MRLMPSFACLSLGLVLLQAARAVHVAGDEVKVRARASLVTTGAWKLRVFKHQSA